VVAERDGWSGTPLTCARLRALRASRRWPRGARPRPGQSVAGRLGDWLPLLDGDGLDPADPAALIVRRDLPDGRTWGSTSVSLVALAPGLVRYDFTGRPGDRSAWYSVL
jgi:hypothetical protein